MAELTTKQTAVIAALLAGNSIEQAARACDVGARTIYRWFQLDAPFNAALAEGRRAALHTAVNQLAHTGHDAAAVVTKIMRDPKASPAVRLRAALGVLDILMKWNELQDFDARLKRLEAGAQPGQEGSDDDEPPRSTPAA